jgi:hypothetical protein
MPLFNNNSEEFSVGFNKNFKILGLDSFKENLEKSFFSNISIRNTSTTSDKANLVLDVNCNYELSEMLYHYDLGTWGHSSDGQISFLEYFTQLVEMNDVDIEIEELSFHYESTSIIINKIYKNSISEQIEDILRKISENFTSITKGCSAEPFEIYIPIFEEEAETDLLQISDSVQTDFKPTDYFKYWALYFEGENNPEIYDVQSTLIASGNLYFLNTP